MEYYLNMKTFKTKDEARHFVVCIAEYRPVSLIIRDKQYRALSIVPNMFSSNVLASGKILFISCN